jgi:polysaccharide export outer membrane protein
MNSINRRIQVFLQACLACLVLLNFAASANASSNDYRLGSGDAIRILVFQNPELTLETRVTESGAITYPLLGSVEVGGLTVNAAERLIEDRLKQGKFVKSPQVNIQVLTVKGNQVSVLGYVTKPGRYPLETFNTRLLDMVATAGGIVPGTGSDVVVLSGVRNGQPFRKEIDTFSMLNESAPEAENEVLQPGDTIYVPKALVFYIYGESQRPGSYRIEKNMTIRQALALGGGPTPRGMELWVRLDRVGQNGKVERISSVSLDEPVRPDDVIYVRESLF